MYGIARDGDRESSFGWPGNNQKSDITATNLLQLNFDLKHLKAQMQLILFTRASV